MMNSGQNQQIELLSKLALQGGGYSWNSTPISDSSSEDPNFCISWPEEAQRRERLAAARRRDNFLLAEPFVRAEEYGETGPRTPYTAPARVVPVRDRIAALQGRFQVEGCLPAGQAQRSILVRCREQDKAFWESFYSRAFQS